MMTILGSFIFKTDSMLPNKRQRSRKQKISTSSLLGRRDKLQHTGPGADEITLTGMLFPHSKIGTADSLDALADLADTGLSHRMIDETGEIHGKWMIDSIEDTSSHNGKQIDFKVKLRRSG